MFRRSSSDPITPQLKALTRLARARLFWERYAPVFAIAGAVLFVFMAAAFSGVWQRIGDPWRGLALIGVVGVLGRAIWLSRDLTFPTQSAARRRVEQDSGISHRPLDTLEDIPALRSDLWPSHYAEAIAASKRLKPAKGRPALSPLDPYYLRFILPVIVGLAMMVGYGDNFERLRQSLTPVWQSAIAPGDISFEAWIDPPEYTGRPPIYFKDEARIDVPVGSELVARISGSKNATRLKLSGQHRSRYLPLERLGPQSFETRAIINERSVARWRVGNTEQEWVLRAVPDRPPRVNFEINPRPDKRDRLAFTYSFEDDYGVESLTLAMTILTDEPWYSDEVKSIGVPLSSRSVRKASFKASALDLTKHQWAGKKVQAVLIATDGLGQEAQTDPVYFTVPDKIFVEPLAKAIVEHRSLVLAGQTEYAPLPRMTRRDWQNAPWFDTFDSRNRLDRAAPSIQRAAALIDAVTDSPEGLFEDPAVFMGLKNVLGRLRYARELADLNGLPEDLWSIAIRAEFGVLGTALEEMREAERALRDGMARRAPQREIDTLFERYNEAVDRYMEELRRKALEEGNIAENTAGQGGDGRNTDEIQALLEAIEEANRLGDTEGARRALAQLAELLENMQIQLSAGGGGGEGEPMEGEMTEEMKKSLEELADLLGEQRELQDETQQAERQQQNGAGEEGAGADGSSNETGDPEQNQGGGGDIMSPSELAERQSALERSLEALSETLPEMEGEGASGEAEGDEPSDGTGSGGQDPAQALAEAQSAMRESQRALGEGDLSDARRAQSDAIDALRRAGQGLAEQVGENRRSAENGEGETDPLGRENNGINDEGSEADIDQRDNAERSREILEELRRRAGEQERSEEELQYLERLLKRF